MKTDAQLQQDVMNELKWDPSVKAAIRVDVKDGVVTLSGYVDSYSKKWAADRAAARVFGVKAVELKKSRSGCPALLSGQTRTSPGRRQMLWSGMSRCPMTASKCRCRMGWLL